MYGRVQTVSKPDKYAHLRLKLKPRTEKGIDFKTAYEAMLEAFMRHKAQQLEEK